MIIHYPAGLPHINKFVLWTMSTKMYLSWAGDAVAGPKNAISLIKADLNNESIRQYIIDKP